MPDILSGNACETEEFKMKQQMLRELMDLKNHKEMERLFVSDAIKGTLLIISKYLHRKRNRAENRHCKFCYLT